MIVHGWGRYLSLDSNILFPNNENECSKFINENCLIPRGAGRSYGDSANAEYILQSSKLKKIIHFDKLRGTITCQSGVTFRELLLLIVPEGWFFPVTPGTSFLTIGGAIAADVHGKNHHNEGSFSDYIEEIKIILGNGDFLSINKKNFSDLFFATCGGMGLTGFIISATFKLKKITSSRILQKTLRFNSLEEVCHNFDKFSLKNYSVAWIDTLAKKNFGRSIFFYGEHENNYNLEIAKINSFNLPKIVPSFLINKNIIKIFNSFYFKKNYITMSKLVNFDSFFYPLDKIKNWNILYGKNGFVQYQFVIPKKDAILNLTAILKTIQDHNEYSSLAVLKLLGKNNQNYLSFPTEGFSLALDFKISNSIIKLIQVLDNMIIEMKGKVYLAKDALMTETMFKKTYPSWEKFQAVREKYFALGKFSSTQAQRIGLK